jgi:hypothetical protein
MAAVDSKRRPEIKYIYYFLNSDEIIGIIRFYNCVYMKYFLIWIEYVNAT